MGFSCFNLLFYVDDDCNRLAKHNYNFTVIQSIRLTFILVSIMIQGILLYVWAKDVFAQLQFYVLLLFIIGIAGVA